MVYRQNQEETGPDGGADGGARGNALAAGALGVPATGDMLVGKYRVERVVGAGGMGVVVAAIHVPLNERVAIKLLHAQSEQKHEVVERFLREGRAAVKIKSEHVARVFDVGTLETGAPYMVMEYLEGSDLAALLKAQGPMAVVEAVDTILQACEAIAEAHILGIVHRDLKPANLFRSHRVDGSVCIKVLDFGISKMASEGDMTVTTKGVVVGSPLFMSPEQMRLARSVDVRTDIWGIGTTLHTLLAGKPPFEAASLTELCAAVLRDPPRRLRSSRADAPEALEAVVLKCLEKSPRRRFTDVAELACALGPFSSEGGQRSVERVARVMARHGSHRSQLSRPETSVEPLADTQAESMRSPSAHTTSDVEITNTDAPKARSHRSRRWRRSWVALVLLSLAGALVAALSIRRPETRPAQFPSSPVPPPHAPSEEAEPTHAVEAPPAFAITTIAPSQELQPLPVIYPPPPPGTVPARVKSATTRLPLPPKLPSVVKVDAALSNEGKAGPAPSGDELFAEPQ